MAQITIYTDGSARGNPGAGGYGAVLISGNNRKEISKGFIHTTNNRMELLGVIAALECIKSTGHDITSYSDSKYVVDSVEKGWLFNWEKKSFRGVKNPDLWKRFLNEYKKHNIKFVWVKGHSVNIENNRCDILATTAAKSSNRVADLGYKK